MSPLPQRKEVATVRLLVIGSVPNSHPVHVGYRRRVGQTRNRRPHRVQTVDDMPRLPLGCLVDDSVPDVLEDDRLIATSDHQIRVESLD